MSIKFDVARCPVCSGKLEPAYEYGHTILRCPYCGFYTYVTITEGGKASFVKEVPIVVPKWTYHARQALNIVRQEISQARKYLTHGDDEEALRRLIWIRDTLVRLPNEAQELPILAKLMTSIRRAEIYFHHDEDLKRFRNEVKDIHDVFIKSSPTVGGKMPRRRRRRRSI